MKILLLGPGSHTFADALSAAGVEFELRPPRLAPGMIVNATGDWLQLLQHSIPAATIASVLVAWVRARASRKIIITTKDKTVIHAEGYSVEQFEKIIDRVDDLAVIDIQKPGQPQ